MSKQWVRQWQVPSSKAGKFYIVSLSREGEWSCACVGWTSHMPRKACRHIKEAKETGNRYLLWLDELAARLDRTSVREKPKQLAIPLNKRSRAITFED